MISAKLATLAELDSVMGTEDLYMLLEILAIDCHNQRAAQSAAERKRN